jgi:ABC-2 type transport system permease protein
VKYVVSIAMYLLFFLCPVMYFSEQVANSPRNQTGGGLLYKIYFLNPVASIIDGFRKTLVLQPQMVPTQMGKVPPNPLNWTYVIIAGLVSFGILVSGYATYNRMKWRFVERP